MQIGLACRNDVMLWCYVQGYDHTQSCIRKATVICLVEIYLCVGEDLRPYLKDLNGSKVGISNLDTYVDKRIAASINITSFVFISDPPLIF